MWISLTRFNWIWTLKIPYAKVPTIASCSPREVRDKSWVQRGHSSRVLPQASLINKGRAGSPAATYGTQVGELEGIPIEPHLSEAAVSIHGRSGERFRRLDSFPPVFLRNVVHTAVGTHGTHFDAIIAVQYIVGVGIPISRRRAGREDSTVREYMRYIRHRRQGLGSPRTGDRSGQQIGPPRNT